MSFFTTIEGDVKADLEGIWNWLGSAEAQAAALLKPIIDELAASIKQDGLIDLSTAATAAAAAFVSGGGAIAPIIAAVVPVLTAQVEKQGITLGETTLNALASSVTASAAITDASV